LKEGAFAKNCRDTHGRASEKDSLGTDSPDCFASPSSRTRIDESGELQRCRCAECETGRHLGCNSSRLRELLGSLFADKPSADDLPGLYCRKSKGDRKPAEDEAECLCAECDLAEGEGGYYYCRAISKRADGSTRSP